MSSHSTSSVASKPEVASKPVSVSFDDLKKYKPFTLTMEEAIFLQKYLTALIETRPGSVKASEATSVGNIHNRIAVFFQMIINAEKSTVSNPTYTKPLPTIRESKEPGEDPENLKNLEKTRRI